MSSSSDIALKNEYYTKRNTLTPKTGPYLYYDTLYKQMHYKIKYLSYEADSFSYKYYRVYYTYYQNKSYYYRFKYISPNIVYEKLYYAKYNDILPSIEYMNKYLTCNKLNTQLQTNLTDAETNYQDSQTQVSDITNKYNECNNSLSIMQQKYFNAKSTNNVLPQTSTYNQEYTNTQNKLPNDGNDLTINPTLSTHGSHNTIHTNFIVYPNKSISKLPLIDTHSLTNTNEEIYNIYNTSKETYSYIQPSTLQTNSESTVQQPTAESTVKPISSESTVKPISAESSTNYPITSVKISNTVSTSDITSGEHDYTNTLDENNSYNEYESTNEYTNNSTDNVVGDAVDNAIINHTLETIKTSYTSVQCPESLTGTSLLSTDSLYNKKIQIRHNADNQITDINICNLINTDNCDTYKTQGDGWNMGFINANSYHQCILNENIETFENRIFNNSSICIITILIMIILIILY